MSQLHPTPQALEIDQHAGTPKWKNPAQNLRRAHLPIPGNCLRLVRAFAIETHESWMEANPNVNMDDVREHKKLVLRKAA